MTKHNKSIYIYDVKIKAGIEFKHKPELISGEYFMVFTDWTPSVGDPKKILNPLSPLSPFGSWYLIRKDLFQVDGNGEITCKPDYMREKLSACNLYDQNLALKEIKNAYHNSTANVGTIDRKVSNNAGVEILTGHFADLGEIIFADNCLHPGVIGKSAQIHGSGAYPWAPIKFKRKFLNAF